ncbi:hypothetical protein Tco_1188414, partial [Tanacetum coccineum]
MSYEDIRLIFERVWDQNQSFVPKDSEIKKEVMNRFGFDFQKQPAKRQKIKKVSESVKEQSTGKEKEVSEEELKKLLVIVPVEEVYIEALQRFDRDDLEKLWDLVKKKFISTEPTIDKEKIITTSTNRLYGGGGILFQLKSDSFPHVHAQTIKTDYQHQDSRIKKAQELKINTFANSDIKDNSLETKLQGRLLKRFQEDAKYEHVGQDIR